MPALHVTSAALRVSSYSPQFVISLKCSVQSVYCYPNTKSDGTVPAFSRSRAVPGLCSGTVPMRIGGGMMASTPDTWVCVIVVYGFTGTDVYHEAIQRRDSSLHADVHHAPINPSGRDTFSARGPHSLGTRSRHPSLHTPTTVATRKRICQPELRPLSADESAGHSRLCRQPRRPARQIERQRKSRGLRLQMC